MIHIFLSHFENLQFLQETDQQLHISALGERIQPSPAGLLVGSTPRSDKLQETILCQNTLREVALQHQVHPSFMVGHIWGPEGWVSWHLLARMTRCGKWNTKSGKYLKLKVKHWSGDWRFHHPLQQIDYYSIIDTSIFQSDLGLGLTVQGPGVGVAFLVVMSLLTL